MDIVWKIIIYGGIFIFGFTAISLWNFYLVTHPPKIITPLTPANFGLPEEEVTIESIDGLRLSAWFMESPAAKNGKKRALIILHGYPADKSDMLFIAASLYPDFTLLLLDLRSFGKSEGAYTTFGIKERADIKKAVDFLVDREYREIGIFGFSLGGAVGILSAAEDKRIGAVASYASFSDIETLGVDTYSQLWILKKPMIKLMLAWAQIFFKESLFEISPVRAAQDLDIPILIIHTMGDEVIPFHHAERLKETLSTNAQAEFYFLEGRLHGDLPPEFYTRLNSFFTQSL